MEGGGGGLGGRPPDPGADGGEPSITLAGFWDGRGLYLNRQRTQRVEFSDDDVLDFGDVADDQAPFLGEKATWVKLKPGAHIDYARTDAPAPAGGTNLEFRVRGDALALLDSSTIGWIFPWGSGKRCYPHPPFFDPLGPL